MPPSTSGITTGTAPSGVWAAARSVVHEARKAAKIINVAFAVSAAFVFGDHLGFTAGVERGLILAMIVGKLVAGISAVVLACRVTPQNASPDA